MRGPTVPNKTGIATQADNVQTPLHIAKLVMAYFPPPYGVVLEPCRGDGNIYNLLPSPKDWCEIREGKDFFDYNGKVDWIITNPPYSNYDRFVAHCFDVADNVVLLCPIAKAFKSMRMEKLIDKFGGLKKILLIGSGAKCGFSFGFPTGCLYYQRHYQGNIMRIVHK